MLEDGLSYPARGDWIGRILIGGVLGAFTIFLVPVFFLLGYYVRVLESTIDGVEDPPTFDDWGDLLVKGLVAFVIATVYTLVPTFVFGVLFVVLAGILGAGGAIGGDGGAAFAGLGLLGILGLVALFVPVMLVVAYLVPAALANYARHGSIGAGFDVGALRPILLSADYAIAVLLAIVIGMAGSMVASVAAATIVGIVLAPFIHFYANVAIHRVIGVAYADVHDITPIDHGDAPTPTSV